MANIFAIGNPVFDLIKTEQTETDGRILSGCSTNFCLAFARLGVRTTLVGNIGADLHQLGELTLVFGEDQDGVGVLDDMGNVFCEQRVVDPDRA